MDDAKENNTQANPNSTSDGVALEARAILGEIKKLLSQKNFDMALQLMEGFIPRVELSETYSDDLENGRCQFNEFLEMALYNHLVKPADPSRKPVPMRYMVCTDNC